MSGFRAVQWLRRQCMLRSVPLLFWVALAGCGLSGGDTKTASRNEAITPGSRSVESLGRSAPVPARESRSPQRVASLHRVDQAKAMITAGEHTRAIAHLEQTLAIDSTNAHVYFHLARAHHGLGNFQASLDFLEVAESLFSAESRRLTEVLVLRGDNLRGLGQLSQARKSYEEALSIDPGNRKAASGLRSVAQPS